MLEATGDFQVTIAVVIAVTIASTIVRILFGYSFATWRFHLRGLSIRGAHDVGWISDMTVGRLMRSDAKTVPENLGLQALRAAYPAGGTKRLYVVDGSGRLYRHHRYRRSARRRDRRRAGRSGGGRPGGSAGAVPAAVSENIRSALARFDALQIETLPVLLSRSQQTVVGYMTEAYALKRYSAELERMRSAELGQRDLFSIGPLPVEQNARALKFGLYRP